MHPFLGQCSILKLQHDYRRGEDCYFLHQSTILHPFSVKIDFSLSVENSEKSVENRRKLSNLSTTISIHEEIINLQTNTIKAFNSTSVYNPKTERPLLNREEARAGSIWHHLPVHREINRHSLRLQIHPQTQASL